MLNRIEEIENFGGGGISSSSVVKSCLSPFKNFFLGYAFHLWGYHPWYHHKSPCHSLSHDYWSLDWMSSREGKRFSLKIYVPNWCFFQNDDRWFLSYLSQGSLLQKASMILIFLLLNWLWLWGFFFFRPSKNLWNLAKSEFL